MLLWKVFLAGVALLAVEDVSAGTSIPVPTVEPTRSGAPTKVPELNPSSGPIGTNGPTPVPERTRGTDYPTPVSNLNPTAGPMVTDGPTTLSNLNPTAGPMGTDSPTPVPVGSRGTDYPTPVSNLNPTVGPMGTDGPTTLSNLNPTAGPMGTDSPTPVPVGSRGTDYPTPVSNLNPTAGPMGTDGPTTLSNLNPTAGPMGTDVPTPVSVGSRGTDYPTPVSNLNPTARPMGTDGPTTLSNLNPTAGPMGTNGPTPVPVGSSGTDYPTPVSNLNPTAGPMGTDGPTTLSNLNPTAGPMGTDVPTPVPVGSRGTDYPTPVSNLNPTAGPVVTGAPSPMTNVNPSGPIETVTPTSVTNVTPSTGHIGTATQTTMSKLSEGPTPKSAPVPNVKTSAGTVTMSPITSHKPLAGSSSQSTGDHSPVTSIRPSIPAQHSTSVPSTVPTTKTTVEPSTTRKQPTTSSVTKLSTAASTSAMKQTTKKMAASTSEQQTTMTTPVAVTNTILKTTKSQVTNKPQSSSAENKTECFEYVGCFDNFPPFDNAGFDLPYSPDVMNTKFWLFTRKNRNNKHGLDYRNVSTFTAFDFDATKPTKFITHGFSQDATATWVVKMKDEFLRLGDFNVITVDWKKGAEFPNYDQAASNTRLVATQIRLVVDILVHRGLKLQDLHLTGHSLGAHTSGYAGFLLNGKVGRISGMDPAEPSFENLPDIVRLDKADAQFVDVIHTNGESIVMGGFGLMESSGHVDFFVNGGESQPGCKSAISGALSSIFGSGGSIGEEVACSHGRSHDLYVESMSSPCPFTSYPCSSYDDFKKGKCLTCGSTGCSQLGYYADQYYARGKMYLNTGSKTPFCGYHYGVEIKTSSTKNTKGRLFVKMEGTWGTSEFVPVTGDDTVKAGSEVQDVIVSPVEVGDLKSLVFKYVKHTGFWLGGGEDTLKVERVKVTSGENGYSYLFCYGGKEVHHNTEARTVITTRAAC